MALEASGFWSYVHDDDHDEQGRIVRLGELIRREYALVTAEALRLFVDRDDLAWGERWRDSIDNALAVGTFFIPVVTPRYFQSDECRKELLTFVRRAREAEVPELVLPILYADVEDLREDSDDEAKAAVASYQWEDWRALRVEDPSSPDHRKGVKRLAERLAQIAEQVAQKPVRTRDGEPVAQRVAQAREVISPRGPLSDEDPEEGGSDEFGLLDLLAQAEEALPRLATHLEAATVVTEQIGSITVEATTELTASDARGTGFAGRLRVANELAKRLQDPSEQLLHHATSYAADLAAADPGVVTLIDLLGEEVADTGPEDRAQAQEFVDGVVGMYVGSAENLVIGEEFSRALGQTAAFSRELRPPIERIQAAIRRINDGVSVIEGWVRRMGAVGFDVSAAGLP